MINKKTDKYTSADIQNEMLKIMSLNVFRKIAANLQNGVWYTIMADEVTDTSNREQVTVCLRWIDEQFEAREEFVGLHKVDQIDSDTIVAVLKDTLLRTNLKIENCRGQCYDGAANMTGAKERVATQLRQTEPRALLTHCYGHALNLAESETIRTSKVMKDALDTTFEISKLIKLSPKRDSLLEKLKSHLSPGVPGYRTLCPTTWKAKGSSFKSVAQNYETLQELWYESKDLTIKYTEMKARIIGVESQMKMLNYVFGVLLAERILAPTDNLSKSLQTTDISANEGQFLCKLGFKTFESERNTESFELFWENCLTYVKSDSNDIQEPLVPRARKRPRRYDENNSNVHFH